LINSNLVNNLKQIKWKITNVLVIVKVVKQETAKTAPAKTVIATVVIAKNNIRKL
jgi:hypothetical protein